MTISHSAKLLGVLLGPGAGDQAFVEPLIKMERRIPIIRSDALGMALSVFRYNQIGFPLFSRWPNFTLPPKLW